MNPYYQDDYVTIYHGDNRVILPELGRFDLMLTDPPYGVNFIGSTTKHSLKSGIGYTQFIDSKDNVKENVIPIISYQIEKCTASIVTPGLACMFMYPEPRSVGWIYYPSGANSGPWGFVCGQPIFYYGKDPYLSKQLGSRPNCFSSTESSDKVNHPCPKPMGQVKWLLNRGSLTGHSIIDPFLGSGTTLRAAKDLCRKAVGIEIEERYCEIAAKRMQQEVLAL